TAATVQPALLARGLRRVALERGVYVCEGSPMTGLDRTRPPRVRTPRGTVAAKSLVLALNAWATRFSELRRALVVIASDIVASEPVPARLAHAGWTSGLAISDSRMLVNYYRTTLDGRIVFGKGGGALAFAGRVGTHFDGASPRRAEVEDSFRALYPELSDVRVITSWTGPVSRTTKGLPCFGRLGGRRDIVYATGYSGNGVGPSYLGGRILASLALELDDEWAGSPLARGPAGRFPPEPVRYVGARLVRHAVARKERDEDVGRRSSPATLALARLAPAGLVPVERGD
ncbi:MAG: NAD(P)/FAD-dependent oxidoreductase, partial [Candidatus Methylomirabilia bacterium]